MFCIKELKNYENFKYMIDFCTDLDLCLFNKQENKIEAKILLDINNNYVLINERGEEIAIFNNLKEALQTLWELKNA
jgi:hypothetical protein